MTSVTVNTYTHSVTYVTDNILKSLKDIVRMAGLDPASFAADWSSNHRAISTWLSSGHLTKVMLDIYHPATNALIIRWEIEVVYGYTGDGGFYTDTEQLRFHIRKAGVAPTDAKYDLTLRRKQGAPPVEGWGSATARSTEGFVRQSLGSTIEHNGLGANAAYWRKP
ncbi:hypothetical protein [Sphingomonas sp. UNC305MFCol5.2]|uniref:hypothetical protein n=1 Tax=Sphingomonas sp. UNC305MFCol5.2 TaxID=1449076 RepID=UPI0004A7027F|nr:hypothetical protein [Sphingomonas sp. UNC305MFCol5.2]